MLNRKNIHILLVLLLMLSLFTTGALANACSCGDVCIHRNILQNQHKAETSSGSEQDCCSADQMQAFPHERAAKADKHMPACCCSEDSETACNCSFETSSNNASMAASAISTFNSENSDFRTIISATADLNTADHIFSRINPQCEIAGIARSIPIYFQNCSLLF